MQVRFNQSRTHTKDGFLKVGMDVIPDPTDKIYSKRYVYVPVVPPDTTEKQLDDKAWLDGLPHIWQINPALIHFITVPETVNWSDLELYARTIFTKDVTATLDHILTLPDYLDYVRALMVNRAKCTTQKIVTSDTKDLISSINEFLNKGTVIPLDEGGSTLPVKLETITVGLKPILRNINQGDDWTCVELNAPANGTGTCTAGSAYFEVGTDDLTVGTFSGSSTTYTCRDSGYVGPVSGGGEQPFSGLTINVVTGDFVGCYFENPAAAALERDSAGFLGYYRVSGKFIDPNDSSSDYALQTDDAISIQLTGTEAGGYIPYPTSERRGLTGGLQVLSGGKQ